ncbi:MATE family efflux transporter [Candidatus Palauibacter sp.]|uniref:MATE family efflux transporter n=1 Tax=Candidatus Palauibacter sp. TaxID=3101350 RepID=UPI003C7015FD
MNLTPRRADLRRMLRLALPIVTVQVGIMMMGVVDTLMVGHLSATDLAAVGLGNLYFFQIAVFGNGLLMALDPIVAQGVAADDHEAAARGIQRAFVLTLFLTVISSLLFLPAARVFALLRQPPDVVPVAGGYAVGSILGLLPFYGFVVLRQSLQAMGRVAPIVWTIAGANLLNAFLNWVLIYGNLGVPRLGAVGSAWGSSLARWCMAAALLALSWRWMRPYLSRFRPEALDRAALVRMVRLGTPIGFQQQLEFGAFAVIGVMMGWLGTEAMAGHQVALNLAALTFMVPLGIGAAAAVRVGHAIGRQDMDGARRAAGTGILIGGTFMFVTAGAFLAVPGFWAGLYSHDPAVIAIAASLIPIAGIFQVADGLQTVAAGVLRGAGDTFFASFFNAIGFWGLGVPVSVVLTFSLDWGPRGLWWGLAAGLAAVAVLLFDRARRVLRREVRRVAIDAPGA